MTPARRRLLLGAMATALAPLAPRLSRAQDAAVPPTDLRATLAAYVDVLLPADALSPAASALGVHDLILELAAGQDLLSRLIGLVAGWLDETGPAPFATLPPAAQAARVDDLSRADPDYLEGRFHQVIRLLAIEFYYADPRALAGLGLAAAPQPDGYPPPWG